MSDDREVPHAADAADELAERRRRADEFLAPALEASNGIKRKRASVRCRDLVVEILRRASEPWVSLRLGGDELACIRPGGIVLLVGGTGRGKSSLACTLLHEHARDYGPALACSLELPPDEWTARAICGPTDASWPDVLQGRVSEERMLEALPARLEIVPNRRGGLGQLDAALAGLREDYPDEPLLAAVDYVQLCKGDQEDVRLRIGEVMERVDDIARRHGAVVIALSQGSRANARALGSGEKIGADAVDTGAESADLERWSTVMLAIGKLGEPAEDGSRAAEISVGKSRMTGAGDRVVPARFDGRTGRWRLTGDGRSAAAVRTERAAEHDEAVVAMFANAMEATLAKASEPMSAAKVKATVVGKGDRKQAAIALLLDAGRAIKVRGKKAGGHWPLLTPARASELGIARAPEDS